MILVDEKNLLFTLHTRNTTYQFKADGHRVLLHTYYGPRVSGGDLSYLIRYDGRSFSPNPPETPDQRDYSLDTLPQEYSGCGVGDYRLPSLDVELSDGSRLTDLRYVGFSLEKGKYALEGLPAFFGDGWETLAVRMRDGVSQVEAELLYGVQEDRDLITRAVRIVNRGSRTVNLHKAASLCLDFQRRDLDYITFDGAHAKERWLHRAALRSGVQSVGSTRGASSHQHNPFVILCDADANEDHGLCYGAMLLYSGNFEAAAELSQFDDARLTLGINPDRFCYALAPGETFTTPEAALVCSPNGFGQMSRQYHRALREHLIRGAALQSERRPVLINHWEATEARFNADKLLEIARSAAPLGLDLFVMDDGWFTGRSDDFGGLGDWAVDEEKLPGGLDALVSRVRELGMSFGIWMEPEMISVDSDLYNAHPDWVLSAPGRPPARGRSQLVLDFSRREVREHIYQAMKRVLDSAEISYLKWDMNRSLSDVWSAALPANRQGEVCHRFVLGVYEFLERLRTEYPHLLIEGCSGGGGRFDAGMLYYTPQIWCSDNTDAVDRLRIQYGTSFCYPVSSMGAHVSAVPNAQTGRSVSLETRGVAAMSGTFGYEMDLSRTTEEEKALIRRQTAFYKRHSDLIREGDYYRLSDPFADGPWTAWEHVSPDRREALVSLVTGTVHAAAPFTTLKLKGLDPAACYQVNGKGCWPGDLLMLAGWPVPQFRDDHQSMQLYLSAI